MQPCLDHRQPSMVQMHPHKCNMHRCVDHEPAKSNQAQTTRTHSSGSQAQSHKKPVDSHMANPSHLSRSQTQAHTIHVCGPESTLSNIYVYSGHMNIILTAIKFVVLRFHNQALGNCLSCIGPEARVSSFIKSYYTLYTRHAE